MKVNETGNLIGFVKAFNVVTPICTLFLWLLHFLFSAVICPFHFVVRFTPFLLVMRIS